MAGIVILSKAKNLLALCSYAFEILRLTPQNDVVGQEINRDLSFDFFLTNESTLRISNKYLTISDKNHDGNFFQINGHKAKVKKDCYRDHAWR
jgi:hypothetical protein